MSIDYDTLMLDPIYDAQGVAATFLSREGERCDLTVLDKIAGVEISQGPLMVPDKKPAACVRVSELEANGLDRAKMKNGRLTFAGNAWNVEATGVKPKPGSKGELYLYLQERKDD